MANIMMTLGAFPFSVDTAAYEKLQRSANYNWVEKERIAYGNSAGRAIGGPSLQFMGPGAQTITISGEFYPQYSGLRVSPACLRLSASAGLPLPLLSIPALPTPTTGSALSDTVINLTNQGISGKPMGFWVIKNIEETHTEFEKWGTARKIEFSLSLQRYVLPQLNQLMSRLY